MQAITYHQGGSKQPCVGVLWLRKLVLTKASLLRVHCLADALVPQRTTRKGHSTADAGSFLSSVNKLVRRVAQGLILRSGNLADKLVG